MAPTRKPGSLLDLLPKRGDVEYNALPKFIRDQIDELRKGGRPVLPGDLREVLELATVLSNRVTDLSVEQRILAAKISDVHRAQSELGGTILKRLDEIQKEQNEQRLLVRDVEKRVDGHDVQLGVHAKKHADTASEITGIHQRVSAVELHLTTKRAPKKRGKARR